MATPSILEFVQALQTVLQGISTASGYFNDVKPTSVVLDVQGALDAIPTTEVPFLVLGHLIEPVSRQILGTSNSGAKVQSALLETWRLTIEAAVDALGTDTARKLVACTELEADIEVAVAANLYTVLPAQRVEVQQATRFFGLGNQNRCYVRVPMDVVLRRNYGTP